MPKMKECFEMRLAFRSVMNGLILSVGSPLHNLRAKLLINTITLSLIKIAHIPLGPKPEVKHTTSHEEPHRVVHEVVRPIIQEVHEIIQPYRRVVQQVGLHYL